MVLLQAGLDLTNFNPLPTFVFAGLTGEQTGINLGNNGWCLKGGGSGVERHDASRKSKDESGWA